MRATRPPTGFPTVADPCRAPHRITGHTRECQADRKIHIEEGRDDRNAPFALLTARFMKHLSEIMHVLRSRTRRHSLLAKRGGTRAREAHAFQMDRGGRIPKRLSF